MSSFDTLESSVETSRPIELYVFQLGGQIFRYTSAEDELTVSSNVYTPIAIKRGPIAVGRQERERVLQIEISPTNEFAQKYSITTPGSKASVNIFRIQRDDGTLTPQQIFAGAVKQVSFPRDGQLASIQVQTIEAATSRAIPRYTFMGQCNHVLYDAACGVSPASHSLIGNASNVSGDQIDVAGLSGSGLDVVSGYVETAGGAERRDIIAQSGDTITLLFPFETDPDGTSVTVFEGCDHRIDGDCNTRFSNEINFGGFAFVPNRNPFVSGV